MEATPEGLCVFVCPELQARTIQSYFIGLFATLDLRLSF